MDLTFVIDSSRSIGQNDFVKAKDFVKEVIKRINVGVNDSHVAIINYGTDIQTITNFNGKQEAKYLVDLVDKIKYLDQNTYTGEALNQCKSIYTTVNGMRNLNEGVSRVIMILTDGASNGLVKPIPVANELKRNGIKIYSVGIGSGINLQELIGMATDGRYYLVADYDKIGQIVGDMTETSCTEPAVIPLETSEIEILQNSFKYFRFPLENFNTSFIEVNVKNRLGQTKLFTSFDKRNPNDLPSTIEGEAQMLRIKRDVSENNVLSIPENSTDLYIGIKGLNTKNVFKIKILERTSAQSKLVANFLLTQFASLCFLIYL